MKYILIILSILLINASLITGQKQCHAMAFSDGGQGVAYQAGAFWGLMNKLNPSDVAYDVVTGVAFGAINAAFLDSQPIGNEKQAADLMKNFWENTDHNKFYRTYLGGLVQAVVFENSVYNTNPMRSTFTNTFGKMKHFRQIDIGGTDVNNGDYVRFNETLTGDDFVTAMMASSAIPVLYPYQYFEGTTFFAGNLVHNIDLAQAIERCRDMGAADQDIYVDTIMTTTEALNPWSGREKTVEAYIREQNMLNYIFAYRDYAESRDYYPNVNFRYVIKPSQTLPDANFLFSFNKDSLTAMVNLGIKDAQAAVERGANDNSVSEEIVRKHYERILKKHMKEPTDENIQNYRQKVKARLEQYQQTRKLKQ